MQNVTDRTKNPFGMRPSCDRYVPGYGDANADFHVIGDHPRVHGGLSSGVPFTNEAGLRLQRALRDGGILVQQSESPLLHRHLIDGIRGNMEKAGFDTIRTLGFPQPCYPSGWWSATQARKSGLLAPPDPERVAESGIETRYYNAEVHRGALATKLL